MTNIVKRDRSSFRERAAELVQQMTLEEKVSQMQHQAPAIPRLGIPAYNWWGEALHGVARAGLATVFPQAISLAASFDPELIREVGDVISTEGRAKFHQQTARGDRDIYKCLTFWSPNVNIFRDPRWGRGHETYGEDPYLTSELGKAFIHGLQGDDETYLKAAACAKHFAVHSGPEHNRHEFDAHASQKDLYETYFPAFKACVQEAQVESVMGAYNRLFGEPCCASEFLLQDVLRDEWKFEGHVVSDCWAIADIWKYHKYFDNPTDSVAKAINAGCDLNCGDCYAHAYDAVIEGKLDEDTIDTSLIRLFTTRMMLGLFDDEETQEYSKIPYSAVDSKEHQAFNMEVAEKVAILLKNDGILPLQKEKYNTIGIIGPNANSRRVLEGNYQGTAGRYWTISEGIQDYLEDTDTRVYVSDGCHLYNDSFSGMGSYNDRASEVQIICDESDVLIAVFGLDSGLEGEQGDTGNKYASGDKPNLLLPGIQREILDIMYASNKPVIMVNMSGSALALDEDDKRAAAVIQYFYPGAMGGKALARILFGETSPQGKLPLSFYSEEYELPDFEDYSMQNRTYRYNKDHVVYPFGYGLTYSSFRVEKVEVSSDTITDEGVNLQVNVKNVGDRRAVETLQVYRKASKNGTDYPELCALKKCELSMGESGQYEIRLDRSAFELFDETGKASVLSGTYTLYVGFSQPDERSVQLMGQSPVEVTLHS